MMEHSPLGKLLDAMQELMEQLPPEQEVADCCREQLEDLGRHSDSSSFLERQPSILAQLAHEVLTPMNTLCGLLDLLKSSCQDQRISGDISSAQLAAAQLLTTVNGAFDLFSVLFSQPIIVETPFSIRELVQDLEHLLSCSLEERKITLVASIGDNIDEMVLGDSRRLSYILYVFLRNSIRNCPFGGGIVLIIKERSADALAIHLGFCVTEAATSLTRKDLSEVLAAFEGDKFQGDFKGTWFEVELALAAKLLTNLGGSVQLASNEVTGVVFQFSLPLKRVLGGVAAEYRTASSLGSPLPKLKILIAEDNLLNQRVATRLLQRDGHEVITATSGSEVLALLEHSQVDLILLDLHMPGLDGYQTVEALRQRDGALSCPIIAVTGFATPEERQKCLAAGMDDFLSKPIDSRALRFKLRQLFFASR